MPRPPVVVLLAVLIGLPAEVSAQDHLHHGATVASDRWTMAWQAAVYLNADLQLRKYTDFHQIESQNWFMAEARRSFGATTVTVHGMSSLEAFTLRRLGSAQAFQTGETLDGAPLVDYQHPHDLFMGAEIVVTRDLTPAARLFVRGGPVAAAALGPTASMHRASALGNVTVPLTHHQLDSTHISRSVIGAGLVVGSTTVDASAFKGREPDEDRLDLDLGMPDSWSARVRWRSRAWGIQMSGARVRDPEPAFFHVATKLTASVDGTADWRGGSVQWLLAYGLEHAPSNRLTGWLLETTWAHRQDSLAYLRGEVADKNILAIMAPMPGMSHSHAVSTVSALTLGYERTLIRMHSGIFAVGGDVTVHGVPIALLDSYGHPVSVHVGIRYRAGAVRIP